MEVNKSTNKINRASKVKLPVWQIWSSLTRKSTDRVQLQALRYNV